MPKKYPEELRNQAVTCFKNGQSVEELFQTYKIAQSTIYRWIKQQQSIVIGDKPYSLSELNRVVRQKERSNHLLEIIRLSNIVDNVPRIKRLEILADLYENTMNIVYMNSVKPWTYQGEPSLTTSSVGQTEPNT